MSGVSGTVVSATQPASPTDGLVWLKTTATGNSTYRYNLATTTFVQIYEIQGGTNTGSLTASKSNFVDCRLMASVPSSALAGKMNAPSYGDI